MLAHRRAGAALAAAQLRRGGMAKLFRVPDAAQREAVRRRAGTPVAESTKNRGPASAQQRYALQRVRDTGGSNIVAHKPTIAPPAALAAFRRDLLAGAFARKYRPDQPRVPAGSSDGGQWTSDEGADEPRLIQTQLTQRSPSPF